MLPIYVFPGASPYRLARGRKQNGSPLVFRAISDRQSIAAPTIKQSWTWRETSHRQFEHGIVRLPIIIDRLPVNMIMRIRDVSNYASQDTPARVPCVPQIYATGISGSTMPLRDAAAGRHIHTYYLSISLSRLRRDDEGG